VQSKRGDVIDLAAHTPQVDLLWGSPPCKQYSLSNPNRGETKLEIGLAKAVCQAIRASNASEVVIENVPAYRKSVSFGIILEQLRCLGFNVQTSILNAFDYGCPSNRPRMICLAVRGRGVLPIEFFQTPAIGWHQTLTKHKDKLPIAKPTNAQFYNPSVIYAIERCGYYQNPKIWMPEDRFPTIKSHTHHDGKPPRGSTGKIGCYRVAYNANIDSEFYSIDPFGLSLLMGFPVNFNLGSSRAEAAAGIGNSVPPPLACAIGRSFSQ
jgi:site-specific DNA-cytosine methylase